MYTLKIVYTQLRKSFVQECVVCIILLLAFPLVFNPGHFRLGIFYSKRLSPIAVQSEYGENRGPGKAKKWSWSLMFWTCSATWAGRCQLWTRWHWKYFPKSITGQSVKFEQSLKETRPSQQCELCNYHLDLWSVRVVRVVWWILWWFLWRIWGVTGYNGG